MNYSKYEALGQGVITEITPNGAKPPGWDWRLGFLGQTGDVYRRRVKPFLELSFLRFEAGELALETDYGEWSQEGKRITLLTPQTRYVILLD